MSDAPTDDLTLLGQPTRGPVDLRDWRQWWAWAAGASWKHPKGPGSTFEDRLDHPVVQAMIPRLSDRRIITYGFFDTQSQLFTNGYVYASGGSLFERSFRWGRFASFENQRSAPTAVGRLDEG